MHRHGPAFGEPWSCFASDQQAVALQCHGTDTWPYYPTVVGSHAEGKGQPRKYSTADATQACNWIVQTEGWRPPCQGPPIARQLLREEAKVDVKKLVLQELTKLVEEALENILRLSYHIAQSDIWSAVYNVVEQVKLDLLCKRVIDKTLNGQTAKLFRTKTAADRISKNLLPSSLFMEPIATFLRCKTD